MKVSTLLKIAAGLVIALIVTAVAILFSMDFSSYKGEIQAAVKDATGRELVIEGEFSPKIGLVPAVVVEKVRFANASWGSRKEMAIVESFRAEIELIPIFFGNIKIKQIVLSGADILLETRKDGTGNWVMDGAKPAEKSSGGGGQGPLSVQVIDRVLVENGKLVFRDGQKNTTTELRIDRLSASTPSEDGPLNIDLTGSYNQQPITLTGNVGSLAALASGSALKIDMAATAGGARVTLKGGIEKPQENKGVNIEFGSEGQTLASLSALAGSPVPDLGPYKIGGTISDKGKAWQVKGLRLQMGESDLAGNVTANPAARLMSVTAALTSERLRLQDFQPRGAAPESSGQKPAAKKNDGRVFPDDPLPVDGMKAANADISFHGKAIEGPALLLTDVTADMKLRNGNLTLRPFKANYAGGTIDTDVNLAASTGTPRLNMKLNIAGLNLGEIIKLAGSPGMLSGKVNVGANVAGQGKSVRRSWRG